MKTLSATDTLVPAPEDGQDAVRYWLVPTVTQVVRDSSGTPSPSAVGCTKMKQTGSESAAETTELTLKYQLSTGSVTAYSGAVPIGSASWLKFLLYDGGTLIDSVTVAVVSDGAAGASGPLPYPCGTYDSSVSYTHTAYMAPVVGCGSLFYLQLKVGTVKGVDPAADVAANGGNWAVFDMFKYLMSEVAFINFGKLASAVFYDRYMFSQYGVNASDEAVETEDGYKDFNYSDPMADTGAFRPNILIDFLSGKMYGREIHLSGNSSVDGQVTLRALYRHILTGGNGTYSNLAEGSGFEMNGDYVAPILQSDKFVELVGLNLSPATRSIQGNGEIYFPNSNNYIHYNGSTYIGVSTLSYEHSGGYIKVTMTGRGYEDYGQCWVVEVDTDSGFEFTVNLV